MPFQPTLRVGSRLPIRRRKRPESGFVSVEFMMAVAFSFLLLVTLTNLVLVQFGRGLVRAAVDEGARAGARYSTNSVAACNDRANSRLAGFALAKDVTITCAVEGDQVRATAAAKFEGWIPGVPTLSEDATATATRAQAPA